MDLAQKLTYNQRLIDITNRLEGLPQPVIAAINGAAFGGGLEFALACSIRVADADAVMGLPEVKLGIVPGSGGTVRLPRLIQVGTALRLLFSGAAVSAEEALQIGIVDQVAPAGEALTAALELAAKIASRAPLAVQLIKASVRDDAELSIADAAQEVQGRLDALMRSADATEGIAAFVEKRPPNFKGE
jgi:enoyl-CoA hydratase